MSLKIHTEVETLYWQPHKVQLSRSSAITARSSRVRTTWEPKAIVADATGYWVGFQSFTTFRGGVYRLNSSFSRTRTINFGTSGPIDPISMAQSPSGDFWVLGNDGQIHRYNSSWSRQGLVTIPNFQYQGSNFFVQTVGLDFDSEGNPWLLDTTGLLMRYDTSSNTVDINSIVSLFEVIGSAPFFDFASSMAIDNVGDFWIWDSSTLHRISGRTFTRVEYFQDSALSNPNFLVYDASSQGGNIVLTSTNFNPEPPQFFVRQVTVPKPQVPALQLASRYLRIAILQVGGLTVLGSTDDPTKLPQVILNLLEIISRQGVVTEVEILTAHLLTFNNLDNESREGYSNSLLSPPVITETLPSLSTSMTSFGGISISIADPEMRRFFDGSETITTTQNPVRVYRSICGKRSLIWNGFLDGIGISATHQTTLNCRPILKKFEQLADFGFSDKSHQWRNHNFVMPIVACKLVPWSVKTQNHSPVGTETFSMLGVKRAGGADSTQLSDPIDSDGGRGSLTTYRYRDYVHSLGIMMEAPYDDIQIFGGDVSFRDDTTSPQKKMLNSLAKEHLDRTKKPTYVSFSKSEIPPSVVTVFEGGAMSFQRGIFFAPTSNDRDAYSRFYITRENYVPAPIPLGALATGNNANFVSQPFFDRFLIGGGDIRPYSSRDWGLIELSDLKQGLRVRYVTENGTLIKGRIQTATSLGYDPFSLFPSLNLGDSYCNWTHIPVPFVETVSDVIRFSNPDFGARRFPPTNGGFFERPVVRYAQIDNYRYTYRPGYEDFSIAPVPHPLDSFFMATYTCRPRITPSEDYYFKAVMYTPHQVGLTYFGRKFDSGIQGTLRNRTRLEPEYYYFTQWATFTAISDNLTLHQKEVRDHHAKVEAYGSESEDRDRRVLWFAPTDGTRGAPRYNTWLSSAGESPYPMARCKDMYTTEQTFENDQAIKNEFLQTIVPSGVGIFGDFFQSTDEQVDPSWKSGAANNMRVMPAYPRTILTAGQTQPSYPSLTLEGKETGAYYVTATYPNLRTCGYWDTNARCNPNAHVNSIDNFRGHYHHHRQDGKGVSPYNFLYSIVKSVGFEPDWEIDDTTYDEMTAENPMQVLSNTGQNYKSLIDRTCPGLGKILRWDPTKNKIEIVNWLTAHRDATRDVQVLYDENCLRFDGLASSSASIPSSFTFENPDILKGENTLEGFSEENKLLGRYVRITSSILIQGKAVTIQTGTWHEDPSKGLGIYNQISDILGYRVNIVNFTVGTEVLLGAGVLGTISVGSWVRLVSPAFSQGVADLFVVETVSSELTTSFKAYRFLGVGIQDIDDNNLPVGSPPISEADIPGDTSPPDDEGLTDGETVMHRVYY